MSDITTMFHRSAEEYKRDTDIRAAYFRDMTLGISKKYGISLEEAQAFIERTTAPDGPLPFNDKPMRIVGKDQHGDRELQETTFLKYIAKARDGGFVLSPSLTMYENANRVRSVSANFISGNVKLRNKAKAEMFAAGEAGNTELQIFKKNEQTNRKLSNNAISGAHCSKSTPLYKPTIHSSLTSMCRCASGYGNSNNEKVISGNRHYWSPDIAEANILAIITHVDFTVFKQFMDEYQLNYPTVDDAFECVKKSCRRYFTNDKRLLDIKRLLEGLTPIELAAFMFVGDLHHLAKINPKFIYTMIERLSGLFLDTNDEDAKTVLKRLPEDAQILTSLICGKFMEGKSLKSLQSFKPEAKRAIASTAANIEHWLKYYYTFVRAIFVTDVVPASIATLPTHVRDNAVASDTDSTIFTVQEWIVWFYGKISFDEKAVNAGHVVAFLTSSSITNILAIQSKSVGVRDSQLFQYAMKSEFYFPVFSLTPRAKTYYGIQGAQEGQVFDKLVLEKKGAVLKGSNTPQFIMSAVNNAIVEILETVRADKKISIMRFLKECADLERKIMNGIAKGETDYYKRGELKPATAYKKDEQNSPYSHYLLWKEVFAEKYGHINEPPYGVIKVNLDSDGNMSKFKQWLDEMEDASIRNKLLVYLAKSNKKLITNVLVPMPIAQAHGVPIEIINGIGIRKIISNLMEPYYVILESLGYYTQDDNQSRLVSDYY